MRKESILSNAPGGLGVIKADKAAKVHGGSIVFDADQPLGAVSFPANPAHVPETPVLLVLLPGGSTKVSPRIVSAVPINMVNLVRRPLFRHVKPRQAVRHILDLADLDDPVTVRAKIPRNAARLRPGVRNEPSELAGFPVVMQELPEGVGFQIRSHGKIIAQWGTEVTQ